jgi:hypothetical protein
MKEAKRPEREDGGRRQYQPPTMAEFGPILKLTQGTL